VAKYAAASRAAITVTSGAGMVVIVVSDDGPGGEDPGKGSGLTGLADRVEALGGTFNVESAPGRGTRLAAEIPLGGQDADALGLPDLRPGMCREDEAVVRRHRRHGLQAEVALAVNRVGERQEAITPVELDTVPLD
jgi:hypothetical protein